MMSTLWNQWGRPIFWEAQPLFFFIAGKLFAMNGAGIVICSSQVRFPKFGASVLRCSGLVRYRLCRYLSQLGCQDSRSDTATVCLANHMCFSALRACGPNTDADCARQSNWLIDTTKIFFRMVLFSSISSCSLVVCYNLPHHRFWRLLQSNLCFIFLRCFICGFWSGNLLGFILCDGCMHP